MVQYSTVQFSIVQLDSYINSDLLKQNIAFVSNFLNMLNTNYSFDHWPSSVFELSGPYVRPHCLKDNKYQILFNRPGVAGAVLQTPSSLIN